MVRDDKIEQMFYVEDCGCIVVQRFVYYHDIDQLRSIRSSRTITKTMKK